MEQRMMIQARAFLTILVLLAVMVSTAAPLWAESGALDPDTLFPTCGSPGAPAPPQCVDPTAKGTKLTGTLTIAYDAALSNFCEEQGKLFLINNQFVVLTVGFNNVTQPFNTDFSQTGTSPMCFEQSTQVQYVADFITNEVIPTLYQCVGTACPRWVFKSVRLLTSGGGAEGAVYAEISIAVK